MTNHDVCPPPLTPQENLSTAAILKNFCTRLLLKIIELSTFAQAILVLAFFLCPREVLITVPAMMPVARAETIPAPATESPAEVKIRATSTIWDGYPLLKRIAGCESLGDPNAEPIQFLNGEVLRGRVNPDDIGAMQINLGVWGTKARELGLDVFSFKGNITFGKWLFDRYGSNPWFLSASCWRT